MSMRFPSSQYPRGWFQVGWSADLTAGDVKPLKYFGEDLVLWRGESGEAFLQDAYCLHFGAHRGVNGWVTGDDLTCPWHGWEWNGEGRNTRIPYGDEGCKARLQIRTYPIREWCGILVAWYDWDRGEPTWEPPELPQYDDSTYYPMHPASDRSWRLKAHPQMPPENAMDFSHTFFIHGSAQVPELVSVEIDGHHLCSTVRVLYGGGKPSTRLTPDGPLYGDVAQSEYGIGLSVTRWDKPLASVMINSFTPIDDEHIEYFFQMTSPRSPGDDGPVATGIAADFLRVQLKVQEQDFFTWENMKTLSRPNPTKDEAEPWLMFRRWARQFYPASAFAGDDLSDADIGE